MSSLISRFNKYFSIVDSKQRRLELIDKYIEYLPRKFSEKEKQILKKKLLSLPLNKWGN